jgi:RNA polymerase sigma-70 factor (ECF subfamily)
MQDPTPDNHPTNRNTPPDEPLTALLARRASRGELDSFNALCARVLPALYGWAQLRVGRRLRRGIEPEDLVQEVWARALTAFEDYDSTRPFRPWLFGIARNVLLEELRGAQRRAADGLDASVARRVLEQAPDEVTSFTRRLARDEALAHFLAQVRELGDDEQTLVRLCGLEGASTREAALALGINEEAAKKRWQRLRVELVRRELPHELLDDAD